MRVTFCCIKNLLSKIANTNKNTKKKTQKILKIIIKNLHSSPAQIVKIAIALAVFCTFGLQFFVCLEIVWNPLKDKCEKRPLACNYVLRTVLVTAAVVLAILVPTIAPFMGLIGAFCFSILGLIMPVSNIHIYFLQRKTKI